MNSSIRLIVPVKCLFTIGPLQFLNLHLNPNFHLYPRLALLFRKLGANPPLTTASGPPAPLRSNLTLNLNNSPKYFPPTGIDTITPALNAQQRGHNPSSSSPTLRASPTTCSYRWLDIFASKLKHLCVHSC